MQGSTKIRVDVTRERECIVLELKPMAPFDHAARYHLQLPN